MAGEQPAGCGRGGRGDSFLAGTWLLNHNTTCNGKISLIICHICQNAPISKHLLSHWIYVCIHLCCKLGIGGGTHKT